MNAFLITFKPETENPKLGWPIGDLLNMVKRNRSGKTVIKRWRFHNRKDVSAGDRVFMLIQGKLGPAIIGYGQIAGEPANSPKGEQTIELMSIVDPTSNTLASKAELKRIKGSELLWRSQASGVIVPSRNCLETRDHGAKKRFQVDREATEVSRREHTPHEP